MAVIRTCRRELAVLDEISSPKLQRGSRLSEKISFFYLALTFSPSTPPGFSSHDIDPPQGVESGEMQKKCRSSSYVVLRLICLTLRNTRVLSALISQRKFCLMFPLYIVFYALILMYDDHDGLSPSVSGELDCRIDEFIKFKGDCATLSHNGSL